MLTCKNTGKARDCVSCKYSPTNQQGMGRGQPINPPVRKDYTCPTYTMVLRESDKAGRA